MTKHKDKTWIFQQAIRYRTLAPRRRAVSKQRRHPPLLPSVLWTRSDSKVKEGRAPPPRTAWNSRRSHSRVALTWGSRLSGYRAWAEPCTRQRVCPEERKMEASGDLDRSSQARLLQHCRQTRRLGSERRTGGPDGNVIGRFKRGYWRNVGNEKNLGLETKMDLIRQSEQTPHLKHVPSTNRTV